jgi:hypothetical protein
MQPSSTPLVDGASQIRSAQEALERAWLAVQESWHDDNQRAFADERIEPLLHHLRRALDATQQLSGVLRTSCQAAADTDRPGE